MAALDRRRFLGALSGAAAAALPGAALAVRAAPALGATSRSAPVMDIGVQLYTVRALMAEEPERTLEALAAIGYREVELAGLYGISPSAFRASLDAVGLRAASSHPSLMHVRQQWEGFLDDALTLGQRQVVVPSIPAGERSGDGLRRVADDFNRAGQSARAKGLRFGYHNHDWEFEALPDGSLPMSVLLERCERDLVDWQMDIFWTVQGGEGPTEWLKAHAGRVTSVHVKDRTPEGDMVDVGQGVLDYQGILGQARELGLQHLFVEHDWPDDPLASVRRSFDHLADIVP